MQIVDNNTIQKSSPSIDIQVMGMSRDQKRNHMKGVRMRDHHSKSVNLFSDSAMNSIENSDPYVMAKPAMKLSSNIESIIQKSLEHSNNDESSFSSRGFSSEKNHYPEQYKVRNAKTEVASDNGRSAALNLKDEIKLKQVEHHLLKEIKNEMVVLKNRIQNDRERSKSVHKSKAT